MSWTIAEMLAIPVASFPIEQPVAGVVKFAADPKEGEKGKSQWFVIKDATGEIGVAYYPGGKDGSHFYAVAVGDQVEICATMGAKGKLTGANKGQYEKEGKLVSKVTVYGDRLKNLSKPVSLQTAAFTPAPAPIAAPGAVATPRQAILSEDQAVAAYWRLFQAHAARLTPKVSAAAVNFEGFLVEADAELLLLCHRAAQAILQGILSGAVSPAPAPKPQQQRRPDPDWMEGAGEP